MNLRALMSGRGERPCIFWSTLVAACLTATVYFPVVHGGFVWDDLLDYRDSAWLLHGNEWMHFILHGFNNWTHYFRPLGVAFLTLQVHFFGATPGPMHAVSLTLHVFNTVLIGALAIRLAATVKPELPTWRTSAVAMLLYGLHPILVEPVAWISCQFDLLVTFFSLLSLIAATYLERRVLRAISVALGFFLTACAKDSGVLLPLTLVVFDWFRLRESRDAGFWLQFKALLKTNGLTYALIIGASVIYLALRYAALGDLSLHMVGPTPPWPARLQVASYVYLQYWRMLLWPIAGMSPVHPVDIERFLAIDWVSIASMLVALPILVMSVVTVIRRRYIGGLILTATLPLLPVLQLLAFNFDQSLYHERYVMPALAMVCVWLPSAWKDISIPTERRRSVFGVVLIALIAWLLPAAANVRAAIPHWSSPLALWQWAYSKHPESIEVRDELISTYIDGGYYGQAWSVIHQVIADKQACTNCMLNAANLSITQNKPAMATYFLSVAKSSPDLQSDNILRRYYLNTLGESQILQGDSVAAEKSAREAIVLDPLNASSHLLLAIALLKQNSLVDAQKEADIAIDLSPASEQDRRRKAFEYWRNAAMPGQK